MWREMNLFLKEQPVLPSCKDLQTLVKPIDRTIFLGIRDGCPYFAVHLPYQDNTIPERLSGLGEFIDLRKAAPFLESKMGSALAYAKGMVYWHQCNQFCGRCGAPTISMEGGHVLLCENGKCAQPLFPRTDPAIIVLVTNNGKCLLGRQETWPKGMYSTLAGFVEPGESLEGAVAREVYEETGVVINRVSYRSSQPWPFPRSLMIGFHGEAEGQTVRLGDELEDARWFSREAIVEGIKDKTLKIPGRYAISYCLIEEWFDQGRLGRLNCLSADPTGGTPKKA